MSGKVFVVIKKIVRFIIAVCLAPFLLTIWLFSALFVIGIEWLVDNDVSHAFSYHLDGMKGWLNWIMFRD